MKKPRDAGLFHGQSVRSEERGNQDRENADPGPDDQSDHDHHGETLKSQKLFHRANSIKVNEF
jgi:hypothetical protein